MTVVESILVEIVVIVRIIFVLIDFVDYALRLVSIFHTAKNIYKRKESR